MKTLNIASTFTNINELYVAEASEMPYATAEATPTEKRPSGFVRFMSSGWGVAMLCALVAVAVTLGILAAGRAAGPVTTLPGAGPTHPTFSFDYGIEDEQALYMPGDRIRILTKVTNLGMPFTVTGSSQAFSADAWLVPHGSEDVYAAEGRINGLFAYTEDYVVQTIEQGRVGKHSGLFTIPEDALAGTYDLVLSYKEEYQVFENAVTIVRTGLPVTGDVSITVFPNLSQGVYVYGETVTIDFMVDGINHLYPSSSTTSEGLTALNYSIEAILTPHGQNVTDPSAITGEVAMDILSTSASSALSLTYWDATFVIPEGATEGSYDLYLFLVNTKSAVSIDLLGHSVTENMLTVKSTHSRFDFHYSIVDGTKTFELGKSYQITTAITNLGEPFTITGSSMAFSAEAKLVHHDDPEKVIQGEFFYDEDVVTQEIATGQIGRHQGYFTIPDDAATGKYDLWLYYGDEYQVFEKALSVEDPTMLPLLQNINFSDYGIFERLQGFSFIQFRHRWGEPDKVSEESEYFWELPQNYDYVAVYFSPDDLSETVIYTNVMKATVTDRQGNHLTVQPYEGEIELSSADAFDVSLANVPQNVMDSIEAGTVIYVSYTGWINETYPGHFQHQGEVTLHPPGRTHYDEEAARAVAHDYMQNFKTAIPLEDMHIGVFENHKSEYYRISYTYLLGGLSTDYKFTMEVGYDGIIRNFKPCTWDPEAYYAVYTDEEVRGAVDRIRKKATAELGIENFSSGIRIFTQRDGKLYISAEFILDCEHEPSCFEGHHHYLFEEEVIKSE